MANRPRILLFGRDGQVGWELRRTLMPLGEIIAPARAEADFADPDSLRAVVRRAAPQLVVNAAAYTDVERAEDESALADRVNGIAPSVIAEEVALQDAALVHYSTDYVFDGTKPGPYSEDDPTAPVSAYGASKCAGEMAIAATGATHLILRTSWVYANRGRNFLRTVLRLAGSRPELAIVADQRGAPTWSRAIAEATAAILARGWRPGQGLGAPSGVYHLTAAGETTWYGFASEIVRLAHMRDAAFPAPPVQPIVTADYPTRAKRPANSVLDNSRLAATFGVALPDWRDQLAACLDEGGPLP